MSWHLERRFNPKKAYHRYYYQRIYWRFFQRRFDYIGWFACIACELKDSRESHLRSDVTITIDGSTSMAMVKNAFFVSIKELLIKKNFYLFICLPIDISKCE